MPSGVLGLWAVMRAAAPSATKVIGLPGVPAADYAIPGVAPGSAHSIEP